MTQLRKRCHCLSSLRKPPSPWGAIQCVPPKRSPAHCLCTVLTARGPPLWDECDAHMSDGVEVEPDWDMAAQPAPGYEVDQCINW